MPRSHAMRKLVTHYARFYRLRDLHHPDLAVYSVPLQAMEDELHTSDRRGGDLRERWTQAVRRACAEHVPEAWQPLLSRHPEAVRLRTAWEQCQLLPVFYHLRHGWTLHQNWRERLQQLAPVPTEPPGATP